MLQFSAAGGGLNDVSIYMDLTAFLEKTQPPLPFGCVFVFVFFLRLDFKRNL